MLFSSIYFIYYFLPILLALYFIAPNKYRNTVMLVFSLIFYSWGEPVYVFLMIFSAVFNYSMAIDIHRDSSTGRGGRRTFIFTVVVNLFILGFFKYYGFLMDTVNGILGTDIKYTALALPIGISFYTFQALSYIVDVYRQKVGVQKNLLDFTLYLALFPQLIAGPIVQYKDIEDQLHNRTITLSEFGIGAERFILGLGKKVLLANNFGAVYSYVSSLSSDDQSVAGLWIGAFAFTLQIYFDFSGYSDMAIGLGKMFGFTFVENFNYPYISKSITEFWRRWHISLSSWFRDYLYLPLGGNRVRVSRHIINLLIVWALTGMWHGASWNFIIWGMYYGILIILEKYLWGDRINTLSPRIQSFYTMFFVVIGWVIFSSDSLNEVIGSLQGMFFLSGKSLINSSALYLIRTNLVLFAIGILASTPGVIKQYKTLISRNKVIALVMLMLVLVLSTAYLVYSSYNPFLYFRF
ncbi:MAG: MBOAT family protein [Peptostreptococcaceae bacterium]|nr:MBOAT family protein [Peptostreptococcaceae bacterium]MDY5739653.1 MBOAT family O-acyltransferase [Anaerovoracaceae bacterium]